MKPLPAKEIMRILERNGFRETRRKGSHVILKHAATGATVPVPLHGGNKPIPIGTFLAIVKQSKLPKEAFRQ